MANLKICQWNCRSAIANKDNLECLLRTNKIDIAFLSETWFKPGKYINFSGYNVVRKDRQDGRGGVAILIKIGIIYQETDYPFIDGIMYTGIIVKNDGSEFSLISLYKKPQVNVNVDSWNRFFGTLKKPFMVGGDFNAHHLAWGCLDNNFSGNSLVESLDHNKRIF